MALTDDMFQVFDVRAHGDIVLLVAILNLLEQSPDDLVPFVQLRLEHLAQRLRGHDSGR